MLLGHPLSHAFCSVKGLFLTALCIPCLNPGKAPGFGIDIQDGNSLPLPPPFQGFPFKKRKQLIRSVGSPTRKFLDPSTSDPRSCVSPKPGWKLRLLSAQSEPRESIVYATLLSLVKPESCGQNHGESLADRPSPNCKPWTSRSSRSDTPALESSTLKNQTPQAYNFPCGSPCAFQSHTEQI